MTKDKFLYELIDNWLYLVSQQCVVMENYTQRDRTEDYRKCSHVLKDCLDFYDLIYKDVNESKRSQQEVDETLWFLIQRLRQEVIREFIDEMKIEIGQYVSGIEKVMDTKLFHDSKGRVQDISRDTLIEFIDYVRKLESEN